MHGGTSNIYKVDEAVTVEKPAEKQSPSTKTRREQKQGGDSSRKGQETKGVVPRDQR